MMRVYRVGQMLLRFEEGQQPEGAVEVSKAVAPKNATAKAAKPRDKKGKSQDK